MTRLIQIVAAAVAAVLTVAPAAPAEQVRVSNSLIVALDTANVPAQEQGMLQEVLVREGQQVKEGEVLARVDDTLPKLQLNVAVAELAAANKRAQDKASIEFAQYGVEVKAKNLERLRKANATQPGSVAATDIDLARLEVTQFEKQLDKSKFELEIAAAEATVSEANKTAADEHIRRCEVKAPWTGSVGQLILHKGEWVKPGDPVLRLVRMDRLAVKCNLSIAKYPPERVIGAPVTVFVTLAEGQTFRFAGVVNGIAPEMIDTQQYQVWVEVQNEERNGLWLLRPSMRAEMVLELK